MAYPKQVKDLLIHPSPKLNRLPEQESKAYLAVVAAKMISALFQVTKIPTNEMLELWAEMILEDFEDLRIVEIKQIFKRAVRQTSKDKKVYDRIDVQTMYGWVQDYYRETQEVIVVARENYHSNLKKEADQDWNEIDVPDHLSRKEEIDKREKEYFQEVARSNMKKTEQHRTKDQEFKENKKLIAAGVLLDAAFRLFIKGIKL